MSTFGEKIRITRLKKGLTQGECAKLAGMTQNNWGYYESGKIKNITGDVAQRMADALKVSTDYLFGTDDKVLDRYPEELQEWLKKEESSEWILKAYMEYLQSKIKS